MQQPSHVRRTHDAVGVSRVVLNHNNSAHLLISVVLEQLLKPDADPRLRALVGGDAESVPFRVVAGHARASAAARRDEVSMAGLSRSSQSCSRDIAACR